MRSLLKCASPCWDTDLATRTTAGMNDCRKPTGLGTDFRIYRRKDVPWIILCNCVVDQVYRVFIFGCESGGSEQNGARRGLGIGRARQEWGRLYWKQTTIAPFSSEIFAESVWRSLSLVCDAHANALPHQTTPDGSSRWSGTFVVVCGTSWRLNEVHKQHEHERFHDLRVVERETLSRTQTKKMENASNQTRKERRRGEERMGKWGTLRRGNKCRDRIGGIQKTSSKDRRL